jgi:hypothetical protein
MTNHNINDSFHKLLNSTFIIYKGLCFEKTSAGYLHYGVLCRDHLDMDILVEQERHSLENSIRLSDKNVKI